MAGLTGLLPKNTYGGLACLNYTGSGLSSTPQALQDGLGGSSAVSISGTTLSGASTTSNFLNVTGTLLGTGNVAANWGLNAQVTSAGSVAQTQGAMLVSLLAGYTGSSATYGAQFTNAAAGTNSVTTSISLGGNTAVEALSSGGGNYNRGVVGRASGGLTVNQGVVGIATSAQPVNIGVMGSALSGTAANIPLLALGGSVNASNFTTSASLVVFGGGNKIASFQGSVINTELVTISSTGALNITNTSAIQLVLGYDISDIANFSVSSTGTLGIYPGQNNIQFLTIYKADGSTSVASVDTTNVRLGVGTNLIGPAATLHVLSTTEQLRLGNTSTQYTNCTVSSAGAVTWAVSAAATNTNGATWLLQAQAALDSNKNGGNIDVQPGPKNGSGLDGSVRLLAGTGGAATIQFQTGTLSGVSVTNNWMNITGTYFANPSVDQTAVSWNFTPNGNSGNKTTIGLDCTLVAGSVGANLNIANRSTNLTAGTNNNTAANTGNFSYRTAGNVAVEADSVATTTGMNVGMSGLAGGGNWNVGVWGSSTTTKASAISIGIAGFGLNAGAGATQVGGYFGLQASNPTFASCALCADNGAVSAPVALFRVNGTAKLTVDASGNLVQASAATLTLGNSATTGLTPGVLAASTNASIVITDQAGQAYRIPVII